MEDRYLFKAKRIDNGEWVEGYLIYSNKDCYICEKPYECMDEYSSLNGQSYGFGGFKLVDPSTICQCTGLKDNNGKLIWENDIMRYQWGGKIRIDVIKYEPPIFTYSKSMRWNLQQDEVIGNIFDNPEFLEREG